MALTIKDGVGATTTLNTFLDGGEHTPYHAITGTVDVSGTVSIGVDKYAYPGGTYGALITKITASNNDPVHITSSFINPIYVTSSIGRELYVASTVSTPVYVTSSNTYPLVIKNSVGSSIARTGFSSFAGTINWAGTSSSDISGTFILAPSSSTRRGLMFANNTDRNLYIALGDTDLAATNGFLLSTTASAPSSYSFILYPSGTYFAEPEFVTFKHSGFFVSSSVGVSITAVSTE
jgi:hypothetical protein